MWDIWKIFIQNGCRFITHSPTISSYMKIVRESVGGCLPHARIRRIAQLTIFFQWKFDTTTNSAGGEYQEGNCKGVLFKSFIVLD